jgi:hypothetical protein
MLNPNGAGDRATKRIRRIARIWGALVIEEGISKQIIRENALEHSYKPHTRRQGNRPGLMKSRSCLGGP